MKILYQNDRFELEFASGPQFFEDLKLAKDAGFTWETETKKWWTRDHLIVLRLKGKGAQSLPSVVQRVKDAEERATQAIVSSRAVDSNCIVPCNPGLEFLPYQKAGIVYSAEHTNTLNADHMGTGKTIQAIGLSNFDSSIRRVLIICPATLKINWAREWKKWDTKGLSVGVVGRKDNDPLEDITQRDVVIVNYDILNKHYEWIRDIAWDLLIVDEAHYLKNPKTARTKQVFGSKKLKIKPINARRRLFLTGTPLVNKPLELWGLVQNIDPDGLGVNFMRYAQRYCDAKQNDFGMWDFSGASNLDELQERMRSRFMIRRLKQDVLKELPPKRRQIVVLSVEKKGLKKLIEREKKAYEDYEITKDLQSAQFADLSKARLEVAMAKVPFAIEHIREALNETEKIIIFGHHHQVLDAIRESFAGIAVGIDGRMSAEDRQKSVDDFQTKEEIKLFVGGIQSAGTGITLTASSFVIFIELDWVPGNISQAEDRAHRIGQANSVQIQHLVLEGSLDERMVEIIIEKQKIIDQALDTLAEKVA